MMKRIALLLLLAYGCECFSQRVFDTIFSERLNAERTLTISLPLSYKKDKKRQYPLVLVMDGEYLFDVFDGNFAYGNYWDDLPEVVLVGLDQNKADERDADTKLSQAGLPEETGAMFFEFVGAELLPYLEKQYRIAPFKIVAGHDLTAGFINLWLFKENPLFNGYIAISPTLGEQMMERIPTMLGTVKKPTFYYLSVGESEDTKDVTALRTLNQNISTLKNQDLYYRFEEFTGATHYSVIPYSVPDALYHIFGPYKPISNKEFQEKIVTLEKDYVGYLTNKYDIIEKYYGTKMPIRIGDFKAIEAAILKNNAYDEFEKLAQLSKKAYPKSMLSAYHMGMYYEKTGDNKKAAKAYQNAYLLDEIGDLTKDMMLNKADELKKGDPK